MYYDAFNTNRSVTHPHTKEKRKAKATVMLVMSESHRVASSGLKRWFHRRKPNSHLNPSLPKSPHPSQWEAWPQRWRQCRSQRGSLRRRRVRWRGRGGQGGDPWWGLAGGIWRRKGTQTPTSSLLYFESLVKEIKPKLKVEASLQEGTQTSKLHAIWIMSHTKLDHASCRTQTSKGPLIFSMCCCAYVHPLNTCESVVVWEAQLCPTTTQIRMRCQVKWKVTPI